MVQDVAGLLFADLQPQAMEQFLVFRPQPRRMRPQVDEIALVLVGLDDLQRELGPGCGQVLPGVAKSFCQGIEGHLARHADHDQRRLQSDGRLQDDVVDFRSGHHQQFDVFAGLFRERDHFAEKKLDVGGEDLPSGQVMLTRAGAVHALDGHYDDVHFARVGFLERPLHYVEPVRVAHGHQHAARPGLRQRRLELRRLLEVELLQLGRLRRRFVSLVNLLADLEQRKQSQSKPDAGDRRRLLGHQIRDRQSEQNQGDEEQPDRQLDAADSEVQRHAPFPRLRLLVAQHEHGQRLHGKAPNHSEGVSFAQHVDVAAADQDGQYLQPRDDVDEPRRGAEFPVRLAQRVRQHAVFGDPVQHAVGAHDGRVHGTGEDHRADHDHEGVKAHSRPQRAGQVHRQTADQVVDIQLRAHPVRNQHHGQERHHRGEQHAVKEDHETGLLEILQLGMRNLAVHLRQGFLAAHSQQRVPQPDQHDDPDQLFHTGPVQPAEAFAGDVEVRGRGQRDRLVAARENRGQRPDDQYDDHHGGDLHDAQRLLARLMHADNVLTPKIDRHHDRDARGKDLRIDHPGLVARRLQRFVQQPGDVEAGADPADRAGQHVIEQQRRHREFRQCPAQGLVNDLVDAAADEHRTALDVHRAHGVAEQHDRQDEPRRRLADCRFGDAAGIKCRAAQVAQYNRRRTPERDEGQHHGRCHHHSRGHPAVRFPIQHRFNLPYCI